MCVHYPTEISLDPQLTVKCSHNIESTSKLANDKPRVKCLNKYLDSNKKLKLYPIRLNLENFKKWIRDLRAEFWPANQNMGVGLKIPKLKVHGWHIYHHVSALNNIFYVFSSFKCCLLFLRSSSINRKVEETCSFSYFT